MHRRRALRRSQHRGALLLVGLSVAISSCSSRTDTTAALSPVASGTRPDTYDTCADPTFAPPANMHLVDLKLPNLGSGLLGHHDVYEAFPQKLEVIIGQNVLGSYDDLDFATSTEQIVGTEVQFSASGAFGTDDRLLILTWMQPRVDGVCAQRSLVGTNVDRSVLVDAARQILGAS